MNNKTGTKGYKGVIWTTYFFQLTKFESDRMFPISPMIYESSSEATILKDVIQVVFPIALVRAWSGCEEVEPKY